MPENQLSFSQAQTMSDYLERAFGWNVFQCAPKDLIKTQSDTYKSWAKSYAKLFNLSNIEQIETDISSAHKLALAEDCQELFSLGQRNY